MIETYFFQYFKTHALPYHSIKMLFSEFVTYAPFANGVTNSFYSVKLVPLPMDTGSWETVNEIEPLFSSPDIFPSRLTFSDFVAIQAKLAVSFYRYSVHFPCKEDVITGIFFVTLFFYNQEMRFGRVNPPGTS